MYSSTFGFYAKYCQASFTYKALHIPWCHFISGLWRVSLAEYIRVLKVTLYLFLIYMLLSEDVTYASNVFGTYIILIIWKLCCFH